MKRIICMILAVLLLGGCAAPTVSTGEAVSIRYDWMTEQSPIPAQITGIDRQGEDNVQNGFECTDTGFYAMCDGWLLYCDHGSDEIIKLCGRPDCTHMDESCNAYFYNGTNVCLEDGYLYIAVDYSHLVRVDLDGTNRVTLLKAEEFSETGFSVRESPHIWDGIFNIGMGYLNDEGEHIVDGYYAPLDTDGNSMTKTSHFIPDQNDGDAYIVHSNEETDNLIWSWDPETNEKVYLTRFNLWDHPGYYGAEDAWFIENGIVYHLNYAVSTPEPVLDTGLDGYHFLHCFPDLLVISDSMDIWDEEPPSDEQTLHFYNWDYELIGQVAVPWLDRIPICGDTPERILLSSAKYEFLPRYYINKAELGTGNIQLHEFVWSEELKDIYDQPPFEFFGLEDAEVHFEYSTWTEEDG